MNCVITAWASHEAELRHYLRRQLQDSALAEDLLQDTFLKALAEGSRFCQLENRRAWLFRVAKNRLIDYHRTHKAHETIVGDLPESPANEAPVVDDLSQCLPRALTELSPADSEVIRLCDIEGISQAEYARLKGLSPAGAKSRIQRARKRLKLHLKAACQVRYDENGKVCCFTPRPPDSTPKP
ncbi:sigma-70 family RNA polymerase sigma factor [Sedimenticola selenatireducens]|uniref:sigma-70 family RNA polymerase sigma factor n=1 Tax=Sedimenticola selenatireducens TaxID=191960 RepID=UPI00048D8A20|nr:sigma-70 family RNA polymerase sigma factor [Sedimenticola selenatireducens]